MSTIHSITKALRPLTKCRRLSSLRSSQRWGPRGSIGRRQRPTGIPDNATKANAALLQPKPIVEVSDNGYNSLSTPVHIPEDPGAVLTTRHPAAKILQNSALVVERQWEVGNILFGFEQANKYAIMDPAGNHVGFMAEEENTLVKAVMRQWARTHRSFQTYVFDKHGVEVLRFCRPFSFINSTITAYDPLDPTTLGDGIPAYAPRSQHRIIGECQQQWHPLRRKYNLFLYQDKPVESNLEPVVGGRGGTYTQFAYIDEPPLSWDFSLLTDSSPPSLIGSVNRNFTGFGREIFTDTGVYALRMDAASVAAEPQHLISNNHKNHFYRVPAAVKTPDSMELQGVGKPAAGRGMTLDERAVMLAAAVSVDFDYFSRHSSAVGHSGFMPIGVLGGGGEHNHSSSAGSGVAGDVGADMIGGAMGGYNNEQQQQEQSQEYSAQKRDPREQQQQQSPRQEGPGEDIGGSSSDGSYGGGDGPWFFGDED